VHLVLPQVLFPGKSALVVPKTDDGRVCFLVPWHGRVLVGTTDTPVEAVSEEPRPLDEEVEFLLVHAARYLAKDPSRADVLSVYAGLRPLVRARREDGNTRALSRDHAILVSPGGVVTVVGGKWTTYRRMGEDTVDRAVKVGELDPTASNTAALRLHGAPGPEERATPGPGLDKPLGTYGTDAARVYALGAEDPSWLSPLHPSLPYLLAEVVWAVRQEMARTVEDVLSRRTRALILDARASLEAAPKVADLMARELKRDADWIREQLTAYGQLANARLL
jgi:glycerol-3-phosphate dehydrogenase